MSYNIDWGVAPRAAEGTNSLVAQQAQQIAGFNPMQSYAQGLNARLQNTKMGADINQTVAQTGLTQAQTGNTMAQTEQTLQQAKLTAVQVQQNIIQNKANEFQLNVNKYKMANSIFGSVAMDPSPQGYQSALQQATKLGIDVSDAPPSWGEAAQFYLQQKGVQSGLALQYWQAENTALQQRYAMMSQMQQNQVQAVDANTKSIQAGLGPQVNVPGGGSGVPQLTSPTMSGVTGNPNGVGAGSDGVSANPSNAGPINQPLQTPNITDTTGGQGGPPGLAGQTKSAQDFATFTQNLAQTDTGYLNRKSLISQALTLSGQLGATSPATGKLIGNLPYGQKLDEISGQLANDKYMNSVPIGFKRALPQIFQGIADSQPSTESYSQWNVEKSNRDMFLNEQGHIFSLTAPIMQQQGVDNSSTAINSVTAAIVNTGAVNNKTGDIDQLKLATWPSQMPQAVQQQLSQQPSDGSFALGVTAADIDAMRKQGYSDAQIQKAMGIK